MTVADFPPRPLEEDARGLWGRMPMPLGQVWLLQGKRVVVWHADGRKSERWQQVSDVQLMWNCGHLDWDAADRQRMRLFI